MRQPLFSWIKFSAKFVPLLFTYSLALIYFSNMCNALFVVINEFISPVLFTWGHGRTGNKEHTCAFSEE